MGNPACPEFIDGPHIQDFSRRILAYFQFKGFCIHAFVWLFGQDAAQDI